MKTSSQYSLRLSLCSVLAVLSSASAFAATLNVPSGPYPTIQSAVSAAVAGDTIVVAAGSYSENVTIATASLTLKGAQAGNPVAGRTFGSGGESTVSGALSTGVGVITVNAANVTIDGFSITNVVTAFAAHGVVVKSGGHYATVTNTIFDTITTTDTGGNGTAQAIYLEGGPDNVSILNNRMNNVQSFRSAKGVIIGDNGAPNASVNALIKGNVMTKIKSTGRGAYGVAVGNAAALSGGVSGLQIRDNTIEDLNGGWAHAIGLEANTPGVVVDGNSISDLVAASADNIAVWFEVNPSFSSGLVNHNSFENVGYGIAVHPALSGTPVDGTCNWWGSATGPTSAGNPGGTGVVVGPNVDFVPWLLSSNLSGPCIGGVAPRVLKQQLLVELQALLPTGDKETDRRLEKAIKDLNDSLDSDLWVDDSHLAKKGKKVFEEEKQTAKEFGKIGLPFQLVSNVLNTLVYADQQLAQVALADAIAGLGDPKDIQKAQDDLATAAARLAAGDFDKAIESYGKAWEDARKALKLN
jgi:hypothetical protein